MCVCIYIYIYNIYTLYTHIHIIHIYTYIYIYIKTFMIFIDRHFRIKFFYQTNRKLKNVLLPIKHLPKTLPSKGINNYIEMRKDNVLEKQE